MNIVVYFWPTVYLLACTVHAWLLPSAALLYGRSVHVVVHNRAWCSLVSCHSMAIAILSSVGDTYVNGQKQTDAKMALVLQSFRMLILIRKIQNKLECGPRPNVITAQPKIGGAVCESSVIPFTAEGVSCSNAANIRERKTWTQSQFCAWQNSIRGQKPPKCIYSVPAQETAKDHAKFGWPTLSDVAAVMQPRRETG